jgi:hypothetical protein
VWFLKSGCRTHPDYKNHTFLPPPLLPKLAVSRQEVECSIKVAMHGHQPYMM